jgi:hypothetical protein
VAKWEPRGARRLLPRRATPQAWAGSPPASKRDALMMLMSLPVAVVLAVLVGQPSGAAGISAANSPPRLSAMTARIGIVHEEGGGRKQGGVKGTYRLCDDGPQSRPGHDGLMSITHRSGNSLLVRERYPSPSWDIYFGEPECRSGIFWSSTIPADLGSIRRSPCYSVALRVRDPGGRWSNVVTRRLNACPKR